MSAFFRAIVGKNQDSLETTSSLKAGVNLKAVFMPIKIGFMEISRSRFKQSKISLLKTEINVVGCFVNF